ATPASPARPARPRLARRIGELKMTIAAPSATTAGAPDPNQAKPQAATDPLANKNVFLQLLVAQLKNQDPLSPADGLQFVTQLAQFTNLEQSLEMNSSLKTIRDTLTAVKPAASTTNPTSSTPSA